MNTSSLPNLLCRVFLVLSGPLVLYVAVSSWLVIDLDAKIAADHIPATGSYYVGGIEFKSELAARTALTERSIGRYFGWIYALPLNLPILLAALSFGHLGGMAALLRELANDLPVSCRRLICLPFFGAMVGLMVFGAATIAPQLVFNSAEGVRPLSLVFLCLLGGVFSEAVFKWAEEKTTAFFVRSSPESSPPPPSSPSPGS